MEREKQIKEIKGLIDKTKKHIDALRKIIKGIKGDGTRSSVFASILSDITVGANMTPAQVYGVLEGVKMDIHDSMKMINPLEALMSSLGNSDSKIKIPKKDVGVD